MMLIGGLRIKKLKVLSNMTNNSGGKSKILIMAAGTGGHVYPALATAEILREQGFDVEWLGTKKGIESRLVP